MDATTTRASTVIRSMPTREIRTQASITMPLSRTRSRTSIKLDPPDMRSTAMNLPPPSDQLGFTPAVARPRGSGTRHHTSPLRKRGRGNRRWHGQVRVIFPPVQSDLLRLIYGANQQPYTNGEQFHIRERNPHVAGDHQSFIENPVENIDKVSCSRDTRHSFHIWIFPNAG